MYVLRATLRSSRNVDDDDTCVLYIQYYCTAYIDPVPLLECYRSYTATALSRLQSSIESYCQLHLQFDRRRVLVLLQYLLAATAITTATSYDWCAYIYYTGFVDCRTGPAVPSSNLLVVLLILGSIRYGSMRARRRRRRLGGAAESPSIHALWRLGYKLRFAFGLHARVPVDVDASGRSNRNQYNCTLLLNDESSNGDIMQQFIVLICPGADILSIQTIYSIILYS